MCLILSPSDFNLFTLVLKFKHVPKCSSGCRPRQIVDLGAESHKVSALLDWSSMGQRVLCRSGMLEWDSAPSSTVIPCWVPQTWGCAHLAGSIQTVQLLNVFLNFSICFSILKTSVSPVAFCISQTQSWKSIWFISSPLRERSMLVEENILDFYHQRRKESRFYDLTNKSS